MANARLGSYRLSEEEERKFLQLMKDPLAFQNFIRLLGSVKKAYTEEQAKVCELHLMNDEPVTRANALLLKGRIQFVDDMLRLIETVTK